MKSLSLLKSDLDPLTLSDTKFKISNEIKDFNQFIAVP